MDKKEEITYKYEQLKPHLNEKTRRLWVATEAQAIGLGGISLVQRATGISRPTIMAGCKEIDNPETIVEARVRRHGGGRKRTVDTDPTFTSDLETFIEPVTRGNPESPLRWSAKSTAKLSEEMNKKNHRSSDKLIARTLKEMDYSLQANKKTNEGKKNQPDRNAQFEHINEKTKKLQKRKQPVISVDTKKKENIGNFKNNGQEYHKKGQPPEVDVYDFIDEKLGKVAPYGVYDIMHNKGWVNVGISNDTAEFAVESIRSWWKEMGKEKYQKASALLITADCGGSNGYRSRLWKKELQTLADELQMTIHVSHFPPGTSKWNKIEHKLFSFISKNWRGKPLVDRATVVNLISGTRTEKGLEIKARLDERQYETGKKVSDEELAEINLLKDKFHGEWNYSISPAIEYG